MSLREIKQLLLRISCLVYDRARIRTQVLQTLQLQSHNRVVVPHHGTASLKGHSGFPLLRSKLYLAFCSVPHTIWPHSSPSSFPTVSTLYSIYYTIPKFTIYILVLCLLLVCSLNLECFSIMGNWLIIQGSDQMPAFLWSLPWSCRWNSFSVLLHHLAPQFYL